MRKELRQGIRANIEKFAKMHDEGRHPFDDAKAVTEDFLQRSSKLKRLSIGYGVISGFLRLGLLVSLVEDFDPITNERNDLIWPKKGVAKILDKPLRPLRKALFNLGMNGIYGFLGDTSDRFLWNSYLASEYLAKRRSSAALGLNSPLHPFVEKVLASLESREDSPHSPR